MKNTSIILNVLFGMAILVLFVLVTKKQNGTSASEEGAPSQITMKDSAGNIVVKQLPIAYITLDSLMHNYDYYNKLKGEYQTTLQAEEAKLQQKVQAFQQEVYQLQTQIQKGLITSRDAAIKEKELGQREQTLMQLQQSKTAELAKREQDLMTQLKDSVQVAIKQYNSDNKFDIVLNNVFSTTLLYGKEQLNITDTVLKVMNQRYAKVVKK